MSSLAFLLTMEPEIVKAFDFAADLSKQLITLSTGFIALTLTFLKEVMRPRSDAPLTLLYLSWFSFVLSVVAGLLTLGALTGQLDSYATLKASDTACFGSVYCGNVKTLGLMQMLFFLAGIILAILFVLLPLKRNSKPPPDTST